jgi:hypothetical protein
MRSNAVGGGGILYFKLGVGRCSYDASTRPIGTLYYVCMYCRIYNDKFLRSKKNVLSVKLLGKGVLMV